MRKQTIWFNTKQLSLLPGSPVADRIRRLSELTVVSGSQLSARPRFTSTLVTAPLGLVDGGRGLCRCVRIVWPQFAVFLHT